MTHYIVLFVALVCSICSTTSKQADHGKIITDEVYMEPAEMPRTNQIPRIVYQEDTNEITSVINRHIKLGNGKMRQYDMRQRRKREMAQDICKNFRYDSATNIITHPRENGSPTYSKNTTCITVIEAPDPNNIIHLTFIDEFHLEDHPKCEYDYIEIRDGKYGFAKIFKRFCGKSFPPKITSTGPHLWLKFQSDENIEYEGFKIKVEIDSSSSNLIAPSVCVIQVEGKKYGVVNSTSEEAKDCWKATTSNSLDILWNITTPEGSKINLNFTHYHLEKPNECELNLVQIFSAAPDMDNEIGFYCGSVSNPVQTKSDVNGNIMFIRFFTTRIYKDNSKFEAKFVSFRTLKGEEKCSDKEFDCEDSTCIDEALKCDGHVDCRLKADEDKDICKKEADSLIKETHILVILVIFTLILSGMSFIFLFKCIRKLYQDHKIIKEHIKQSCEDRLDQLGETQLTLDPKLLDRLSEPRASLERENHTNEMYKQQRNKRKPSSIDSDFLPETHLDVVDEWRREAENIPVEDVRIEHKGRSRRSESRRGSLRSRSAKEEERREIRDASVGAPDTKESGCQTRESLFQTETAPSSDGTDSNTNSRGFSTFGYSGATIVRPSPAPNTSEITIELLRQVTPQESVKPQKKTDRRPMSTETTRSAPDVIIVSKPIR